VVNLQQNCSLRTIRFEIIRIGLVSDAYLYGVIFIIIMLRVELL
jgi:hypothetical protein